MHQLDAARHAALASPPCRVTIHHMDAARPGNVITVRGARVHNLQNVDIDVPRDCLVVVTGVSGSGKSSLAFDTLYAEGQRRYLESLSAWTRQFFNQLERPDVDSISGLPPTISLEQRAGSVQTRSTLSTTTEIHDYLRLLYARAGTAHCPRCGRAVSQQSTERIVRSMLALEERRKVMILAPIVRGRKGQHRDVFERIVKDGFVRARVNGDLIDATEPPELAASKMHSIEAVIDRIVIKEGIEPRLRESVDLAVKHGDGTCIVAAQTGTDWQDQLFSTRFACAHCDVSYPNLEPRSFSFNSPYGACEDCSGLGYLQTDDDVPLTRVCTSCDGSRLAPFPRCVTVAERRISEVADMTVDAALDHFEEVLSSATEFAEDIRIVRQTTAAQIKTRLQFLKKVGLDYLQLGRSTRTLSGGEFQRARLAACLGSGLTGVCYILDEPTIGLHPVDTERLIQTLDELRDSGNSLIVVEHDEAMIRRADYVIDIGPGAGRDGGRVVAAGGPEDILASESSITGMFLRQSGKTRSHCEPPPDRGPKDALKLTVARCNNLQSVSVEFPLRKLVCVTGVSGSGKSSLVMQTLVPAVKASLTREMSAETICHRWQFDSLENVGAVDRLVEINQSPLGRTGRSNAATYTGLWDEVRKLYAKTRDSRVRGFKARRFSFNAKEGRCPECNGQGTRRIEMNYLPDMYVECPVCRGARFNRQTLSVRFRGKTVADILAMRIDRAAEFFENIPKVSRVLQMLCDVGLGYLGLGQSALTLSGGEAQRIRLATELSRTGESRGLYVLDEPTTGLHAADVDRLVQVLRRLVEGGQSVIVVEHNTDVMLASDWLVDMGPGGGTAGGHVVFTGRPIEAVNCADSETGKALSGQVGPPG